MKKLIAAVTTGLIAIALVLVGAAAPASAHTASLTGSNVCSTDTGGAVVTWTVHNDYTTPLTISYTSKQDIVPVNTPLAAGATATFTEDILPPAAGVTDTLTLSFHWSDWDQNYTKATTTVSSNCAITDASAAIVLTPAGCGSPETVAEVTPATNATWTTSTITSNSYTLVATATAGHSFATHSPGGVLSHNNTIETFHNSLSGATNPSQCKLAAAALVFTDASCQAPETVAEGTPVNASWTSFNVSGSSYTAMATANNGFEFSNGHTTLSFSGTLDVQWSGHPCEDYVTVAWKMPGPWVNSTTPSWTPYQTYFTSQETAAPDLDVLDTLLNGSCGQFQVDIYYNSSITTSLINGGKLYGPNNPAEDLLNGGADGWGHDYKLLDEPACATPNVPTETDSCGNGGTITLTPAEGVDYYLNGSNTPISGTTLTGLTGTNTITAGAQAGYRLTTLPNAGTWTWTFDIDTNCTATYDSLGTCTVVNNVSFEDVSVTFDNPSKTDVTFEVTSPDSTVTDYPVGAGESLGPVDVGPVSSDGGTFLVSIVGGDSLPNIVVGSFTGCIVTVHPVKPTVHRITTCGETGGSIDITLTAGIEYYVNGTLLTDGDYTSVTTGLTGTVHVTAVAENGYAFGQGDKSHWWLKLGEPSTCTVTLVTPVCTATNGGFYAPVTLTFDNPGKHGVSVDVTGGSIATSVDFTVPGHSTDWPYLVDANGQSGDVYTVTINGVVQAPIDLSFADCPITVYPTDPTVQDTTCTQATEGVPSVLVGGSITTDGNPNLTYTLYTVVGGNPTNPVVFPGNPSPVLSGLPGGQYLVTVASNNPDYIIGTPTDFPFTVALTDRDCGGTTLTPVVTSDDTCAATGIITTADSPVSKFQAAITYVDGGVINLPQQPGILVFKINGVEQDDTAVTEPNGGPYVVTVSLTSAAIADGYVLSDPDVSWTYSFDSFCPPTGATWNAGATGSNAVCTSGTTTDGVITLEHDTDQDGKVTYTITNDAAPTVIVYHGTNSTPGNTLVNVGAGHYTVTAKATDVADGLSGSTNPDGSETFNIHVTLTSSDCVGDLAFTGGTIAWLGFVLAGGMLFLGFALLYMRRRGHRTAE